VLVDESGFVGVRAKLLPAMSTMSSADMARWYSRGECDCAIDGWMVSLGSLLLCLFACSLVSGDGSGGFSGLDGMVDEDAKM
jgi:hypothetical protein